MRFEGASTERNSGYDGSIGPIHREGLACLAGDTAKVPESAKSAQFITPFAAISCQAIMTSMASDLHPDDDLLTQPVLSKYLEPFADLPILQERIVKVLRSLPQEIQADFVHDKRFQITLDNFQAGKGWSLVMDLPPPGGDASRCVVLKPKLENCGEAFACYVIAHEFAHAFLRNGGWGEITDREDAADALAAKWGFERPSPLMRWF